MGVTRYGIREWGAILLVTGGGAAGAAWLGWWWAVVLFVLVAFAGLAFFRDPWRRIPADLAPGDLLAPADGLISAIERVETHPITDGPAIVVRIYLSVLDVHLNRSPCDGTVISTVHTPGRYLDVRNEAAARENENLLMTLQREGDAAAIGVRQIAGLVARRIVCPVDVGTRIGRGRRYGMIKFGSSTELILADREGAEVHVALRQRVRGGQTVLATLPPGVPGDPGTIED